MHNGTNGLSDVPVLYCWKDCRSEEVPVKLFTFENFGLKCLVNNPGETVFDRRQAFNLIIVHTYSNTGSEVAKGGR